MVTGAKSEILASGNFDASFFFVYLVRQNAPGVTTLHSWIP